jgi:macrolide transport system ATP-binding/permease protein
MMAGNNVIIRINNLSRVYYMGDSAVRALDEIDLEIESGDFLMIVGSSGSGKSTVLNILGLLDLPTSGTMEISGHQSTDFDDDLISRLRNQHIGFVFQQFNLLNSLTIIENIALPLAYGGVPKDQRRAAAARYACMVGLEDRLYHRPSELSGGQLQRAAIARALVNQPDIILADEPTGNLDSTTGQEIMKLFYDLHDQGYTIVMVTHDSQLAATGSRLVTFNDGKIVEETRTFSEQQEPTVGKEKTSIFQHEKIRDRTPGLRFTELMRIGMIEGLLPHKMRTFLTTLGIVIGVSSVIAMSSFSLGSKQKQIEQIRALGANLVRITDHYLENESLINSRINGSQGLNRQDIETILHNLPQVVYWACIREIKLNVLRNRSRLNPRVIGVFGDYLKVNNLQIKTGRFFDENDYHTSSRVVVLGANFLPEFDETGVIGSTLSLGGVPYTIIGTLNAKHVDLKDLEASGIEDPNNDLLIPLETLLTRTTYLPLRSELDEIQLQLSSEDELYTASRAIKRSLEVTHNGVADFDVVVPMDLLKQKQQAQRLLDVLTICISAISLIVGGIGIMNIMLTSVTERTREIGIRRAVGARAGDIRYQFLSESILISFAGGILGIAFAVIVVLISCAALNIPVVFSPALIITAAVAATITGLGFGLYPAHIAAKKNPVEALRYE